jgi:carboxymethylenebutenolidase
VILHEIFGVDGFIRQQAHHWAARGYTVLAPALFDRCSAGLEAAHDSQGIAQGLSWLAATPDAQALSDIDACIAHARSDGPVHLLGFCYGGRLAWTAAAHLPGVQSAVVFYGNVLVGAGEDPRCPVMLHFGALDAHLPVNRIMAELPHRAPMGIAHLYPHAGHGFVNPKSIDHRPDDAATALRRCGSFFDAQA